MEKYTIILVNDAEEIRRTFNSKYLMCKSITKLINRGYTLINIIIEKEERGL